MSEKKPKRIYSPAKQKVLLLLQAGLALSYVGTLGRQIRLLKEVSKEWKGIEEKYLRQIVREFYVDRLVSEQEHADGTTTLVLTERGKKRAVTFNIDRLKISPKKDWDGKWYGVFFDIPETQKLKRHAFRGKLQELGFHQWQKSVFVHPYPCRDEIDFVVEFFGLRSHVRFGVLTDITNEAELVLHFGLKPVK